VGEGVAPDKRVDVEGVGAVTGDPLSGIDSETVEKDTGDFVAPHTDTWSGGEGDSLGQQDAVTSEVPADLFSVAAAGKTADVETIPQDTGSGFPDHDPTHVDLEALLKEEVGGPTETDSTATAFRSLEQAPAVTKDLNGNDVGGPIGDAIASAKSQIVKAMKVAEAEVGLGLIGADAKFDRVAELEGSEESVLDAQLDTLSKVKTAGLSKARPQQRIAGRLPSLQNKISAEQASIIATSGIEDQQIEDAIFF
jgi:outer membrane lipoprotein SlyB